MRKARKKKVVKAGRRRKREAGRKEGKHND